MRRIRVLALLLGLLGGVLPLQTATADSGTNGDVMFFDGMLDASTGVSKPFGFTGWFLAPTEFSPDGTRVASLSTPGGGSPAGRLTVTDHTGAVVKTVNLPLPPGGIGSVTWSPDGKRVAVLLRKTNGTGRIALVDLGTAQITTLLDSTSDGSTPGRIVELEGISWHPSSGTIAWVGETATEFGAPYNAFRQIMTVDAATGGVAAYTSHPDLDCDTCPYASFARPDWSPDGTQIVSQEELTRSDGSERITVTRVSPGQVSGTPVIADAKFNNRPVWSPDGSKVLLSRSVDGELVGTVVPLGAGTTTDVPAGYLDWQPCPTGTCAPWSSAATTATITMNYRVTTGVRISGTVSPDRSGRPVKVVLSVQKGSKWSVVAKKSATLDAASSYSVRFARRNVWQCRAVARYAGDAQTSAASATKYFSC